MDWIVELTTEQLYGPTTLGSIREFLRLGEIDENSFVINACDGTRQQIRDVTPRLEAAPSESESQESVSGPASAGMSIAIQDRIRELEEALRAERRAHAALEQQFRELEERHQRLVDAAAVSTTS